MALEIATRSEGGATVLAVSGDIDVRSAGELRDALDAAVATGNGRSVVVDLAGTDFLDSSALGALVGANKQFESASGRLVIVCDKPHLLRVFQITRLGDVLTIVPTLDAALA